MIFRLLMPAVLAALPLFITTGMLWLRANDRGAYDVLLAEDGLVENLQATIFAVSGLAALRIATDRRTACRKRRLFFVSLGVGLIFVALEEISWGQRLFGLQTPSALHSHNAQKELNLHNLHFLQEDIKQAGISLLSLIPTIVSLALAISAFLSVRPSEASSFARSGLLPSRKLTLFFLMMPLFFLGYAYCRACLPWSAPQPRDQELFELIFASGVMLWILHCQENAKIHPRVSLSKARHE